MKPTIFFSCSTTLFVPTGFVVAAGLWLPMAAVAVPANKHPVAPNQAAAAKKGCEDVDKIPSFDIGAEAGNYNSLFNPKAEKGELAGKGFKITQGLSLKTGTWTITKCLCPSNPQEKKLYSASLKGVELQLEGDVKNPWEVKVENNIDVLGLNVSGKAWAGINPTLGGGIKNLDATFTVDDCSAPQRQKAYINGTVNAYVQVKVGVGASGKLVVNVLGAKATVAEGTAEFDALDSGKIGADSTFSYQHVSGSAPKLDANICAGPVIVTMGKITANVKFPPDFEFDLSDKLGGLFDGYKIHAISRTCFRNS